MTQPNHHNQPNTPTPPEDALRNDLHQTDAQKEAITDALNNNTDPFVADALEGLQQFNNNQQLQQYVTDLNQQLLQQTKNKRKRTQKINSNQFSTIAILIILSLCIMGYFI